MINNDHTKRNTRPDMDGHRAGRNCYDEECEMYYIELGENEE